MGIKMTCECCFGKFDATTKEQTQPDDNGYVLCLQCQLSPESATDAAILAIAPYVGVNVNHTDYTQGYHKAWKAFSLQLRRIKTERGDNQ